MGTVDEPLVVGSFSNAGSVLLVLAGELDIATVPEVRAALGEVRRGELKVLTIDVGELTFIDVSGQRLLVEAAAAVTDMGARFELREINPAIRRAIRLVGFEELAQACDLAPD